jgi:putative peptidoglycan lipid II flippase
MKTPDATPPQADETLLMEVPPPQPKRSGGAASAMVAGGILLSRVAGLVRERVTAQFLGTSLYADAFRAGLRMPNFLQNMLGEGTLSASFIPIYSELLHEGRREDAGRFAGAIFSLLLALAGVLSLVGVIFAPLLTDVFLPGYEGARRELTIQITRIIFPMTGVLVLSAWSLGILNSHRYFFVPYFAPVLWNAAIITTLFVFGERMEPGRLVIAMAWGALVGGGLQFLVQLPWVFRLERSLRISWNTRLAGVREAIRNAGPAIMGRGVVQLSGYVDIFLASLLAIGAVSTLTYAMTLYLLPVSLFGMSVAAAELPELSRQRGAALEVLRERANAALSRISFYIVPSFVGFLLLGDVIVAALYQTGEFDHDDTLWVYVTLVGLASGLLASTWSRLFSSTYFALRDTRTPARYATVRVTLSAVLGIALMLLFEGVDLGRFQLPAGPLAHVRVAGHPLGVFGLALGAGIAAWIEWWLLRRTLKPRVGDVGVPAGTLAKLFGAALLGAAAGWGVRLLVPGLYPLLLGLLAVAAFGAVYFGVTAALGIGEAAAFLGRFRRVLGRR